MMTRIRPASIGLAVLLGTAASVVVAQTSAASAPIPKAQSADKKFVDAAAVGGLTEVKLGQLAGTNGDSPAVKALGQHMVDDHSKANEELAALAKSKGIGPPAAPDAAHQKAIDKFGALKGKEFDTAYWKQMLDDHKKTIALFQTEAKSGKDPDVKAFAEKTLPTLKMHLQMVEDGMKGKG